ncbi:uncharacterized protein LACBIDRAFT_313360 [Laccaria bicolor S238N-H82]|uniref:Predicted protein n=1 Tax=Laccaria bicolor (strain S238N-H82 / ATCC MYA-4686) TaxID=486041 RepID=B0DY57_LACBS|nr:uncharacterized protein LACBIDRAFT_313360 [Laccaria bicolor S238N-H82]EDR00464.1 predicted protein [Laccaria bicolor S238N-H82]|eukprot:XP_001888856.1 predicted protein [Laccaria bicolor S238N-H82]
MRGVVDPTTTKRYLPSRIKKEIEMGIASLSEEKEVVFESPVRSGFLMPRGVNRNRNRSAFSPEVKRPDRTAKRPQTAVFCGL